jgi:uncharacterized membrane protein
MQAPFGVVTPAGKQVWVVHVGGFVAGLAFGIVLLTTKVVVRDNIDQAIFRGLNI